MLNKKCRHLVLTKGTISLPQTVGEISVCIVSYDLMEAARIPYNRGQTTSTIKAGIEMVLSCSLELDSSIAEVLETPNPGS